MMERMQAARSDLDILSLESCEDDGFEEVLVGFRIREIVSRMRGESLLDVGCGVGNACRAVSGRMSRVVGIDGAERKIQLARQRTVAANVKYVATLFEEFQPDQTFDTVVLNNILEHVEDPVYLLRCVSDWLAPEGIAIITVPNAYSLNKRIGLRMGLISSLYELTDGDRVKGHVRVYDRNSLTGDIEAAGLRVTFSGGLFLKPFSNAQMEGFADEGLLEALYEVGKELPDYCGSLLLCAEK